MIEVVTECAQAHVAEAVLFGNIFYFDYGFSNGLNWFTLIIFCHACLAEAIQTGITPCQTEAFQAGNLYDFFYKPAWIRHAEELISFCNVWVLVFSTFTTRIMKSWCKKNYEWEDTIYFRPSIVFKGSDSFINSQFSKRSCLYINAHSIKRPNARPGNYPA